MKIILLLCCIFYCLPASSNNDTLPRSGDSDKQYINVITSGKQTGDKEPLAADGNREFIITNKEALLSLCVLAALLIVLLTEVWLIHSRKISDDHAVKLIIISLVIMSVLFLIMGGYDDHFIAPAFGLFGTVAGYIFGRSGATNDSNTNK